MGVMVVPRACVDCEYMASLGWLAAWLNVQWQALLVCAPSPGAGPPPVHQKNLPREDGAGSRGARVCMLMYVLASHGFLCRAVPRLDARASRSTR